MLLSRIGSLGATFYKQYVAPIVTSYFYNIASSVSATITRTTESIIMCIGSVDVASGDSDPILSVYNSDGSFSQAKQYRANYANKLESFFISDDLPYDGVSKYFVNCSIIGRNSEFLVLDNLFNLTIAKSYAIPNYSVSLRDGSYNSIVNKVFVSGSISPTVYSQAILFYARLDTSGIIENIKFFRSSNIITPSSGANTNIVTTILTNDDGTKAFLIGRTQITSTFEGMFIRCYDTATGNVLWTKSLNSVTNNTIGAGGIQMAYENNYLYFATNYTSGTTRYLWLAKFDELGNLITQKTMNLSMGGVQGITVVNGRVFLAIAGNTSYTNSRLMELDTSFNLIWSNRLTALIGTSLKSFFISHIFLEGNDICLSLTGTIGSTLLKFPADGSIPGTGSYLNSGITLSYIQSIVTISDATQSVQSLTMTAPTIATPTTTTTTANWSVSTLGISNSITYI